MSLSLASPFLFFFFFNDTATTEIYTLSLHDALPISAWLLTRRPCTCFIKKANIFRYAVPSMWLVPHRAIQSLCRLALWWTSHIEGDRKSTRLNSSHTWISYAVFCFKKKKKKI